MKEKPCLDKDDREREDSVKSLVIFQGLGSLPLYLISLVSFLVLEIQQNFKEILITTMLYHIKSVVVNNTRHLVHSTPGE